jgi:hypothetical protein
MCGYDQLAILNASGEWSILELEMHAGRMLEFKDEFILTMGYANCLDGGDIGLYLSTDSGVTWQDLNHRPNHWYPLWNTVALGFFSNQNIIIAGNVQNKTMTGSDIWNGGWLYFSTDLCSTWTIIDTIPEIQTGVSYTADSSERM